MIEIDRYRFIEQRISEFVGLEYDESGNICLYSDISPILESLKSLVDGASNIVEIYPVGSPAQKEWKADWIAKAREALK